MFVIGSINIEKKNKQKSDKNLVLYAMSHAIDKIGDTHF